MKKNEVEGDERSSHVHERANEKKNTKHGFAYINKLINYLDTRSVEDHVYVMKWGIQHFPQTSTHLLSCYIVYSGVSLICCWLKCYWNNRLMCCWNATTISPPAVYRSSTWYYIEAINQNYYDCLESYLTERKRDKKPTPNQTILFEFSMGLARQPTVRCAIISVTIYTLNTMKKKKFANWKTTQTITTTTKSTNWICLFNWLGSSAHQQPTVNMRLWLYLISILNAISFVQIFARAHSSMQWG